MKLRFALSALGALFASFANAEEVAENNHHISYGVESVYKKNATDFSDKDTPYYGAFIMYQYLPLNSVNVRVGLDLAVGIDQENKHLPKDKKGVAAHAAGDSFVHVGYRIAPLANVSVTPLAGIRNTSDSQAVKLQDDDTSTTNTTGYNSFLVGGLLDAQVTSTFHVGFGAEYHLAGNGKAEGGLSSQRKGVQVTSRRQIKGSGRYYHLEVPASYQFSETLSARAAYTYTNRELVNDDTTADRGYNLGSSKVQLGLMHSF